MPNPTVDPLLRRLGTPLRELFYPIGFRLEIETNDARVLAHAQSFFGLFTEQDHELPVLRLRVVCDPAATAGPPWPAHSFRSHRDLMTVVSSAENLLTFDLARANGAAFFSSQLIADRDYFCRTFLACFVWSVLQRHAMTPFHAACVVRNGRAICLAGPPNAGKSSLAYALARHGYSLLSDDACYIMNDDCVPGEIRGNPARLHLRPESRALFPELAELPLSVRANGEQFLGLPTVDLLPGRLATKAQFGALMLLNRRAECDPGFEDVSPEETHRLLWQDCLPGDDEPVMQRHDQVLRRISRHGARRMRYSTFDQAFKLLEGVI